MRTSEYAAVIFDMDGTVLNTVDDLTDAMNYAMAVTGHRCDFTGQDTKCFFGSGVVVAVRRALAMEAGADRDLLDVIGTGDEEKAAGENGLDRFLRDDPVEQERILAVFRPYYEAHCRDKTAPYPGVPELLRMLREAGIRTAVVSNKPDPAVQALAVELFPSMFDLACGERPSVPRKPAPDMVRQALDGMGVSAENALYVGDSEIDVQTARNAGMDCCAVTWGFRPAAYLRALRPDRMADTAEELLEICTGRTGGVSAADRHRPEKG